VRLIPLDRFLRRCTGAWVTVGLVLGAGAGIEGQRAGESAAVPPPIPAALTSSVRLRLPADISQVWLVPDPPGPASAPKPLAPFADGMRLFAQAKYAEALPLLSSSSLADTPTAAYAAFYGGLCLLNLSRAAEARTAFARLHAADIPGYLSEAAVGREAEAASAQGDHAAAAKLYDELSRRRTASPDAVLLALGKEYRAAGATAPAAEAFARLYYEFPLSDLASVAATELNGLQDVEAPKEPNARFKLDLGRAERLFGFKRYLPAQQAFEALEPLATGDDAEVVALRLAECDYFQRRYGQARERLAPYLERASRKIEARFFSLSATRELGEHEDYVRQARALVDEFPDSSWADEALNNLGTHFILEDEDEQADAVFRELFAKFPQGPHAERAAWKAGWWAYKHGRYRDTIGFYESAAALFPRSDYRPAFLYWSGRSREQIGDAPGAAALYRIAVADYLNSYYGRLAARRLAGTGVQATAGPAAPPSPAPQAPAATPPPTADLIRLLISLGLNDQARDELLYAQRTWGETPLVNATLGWVLNRQGDLRRGIIYMKRAYPAYLSNEGGRLPVEVLKVIFPIDYWTLIKKYAPAYKLDPYLVAALINQESAFDADVKSSANAVGLMQLLPSTAKRYARTLRLSRYSAASLTRPEVNLQIGMAYFANLIRQFNGVHHALASYNAGEHRVYTWNADRPGLDVDEYIDDIPFPETQTYVKRIIGTADDYRRLYGADPGTARTSAAKPPAASKGKPAAPARKKPAPVKPAPKKVAPTKAGK
jgi:peptidoglycan lytic transglycosylase